MKNSRESVELSTINVWNNVSSGFEMETEKLLDLVKSGQNIITVLMSPRYSTLVGTHKKYKAVNFWIIKKFVEHWEGRALTAPFWESVKF